MAFGWFPNLMMKNNSMKGGSMTNCDKYQCPKCESEETKSAKAIYLEHYEIEEKETTKEAGTFGTKPSITKGVEKSITKKHNLLVKHCAPPTNPAPYPIIFLMLFSLALAYGLNVYFSMSAFVFMPIFIALFFILHKICWFIMRDGIYAKEKEYVKKFKEWENTWYCPRCAHTWLAD